ncbi:hypothetical protein NBRC116590_02460 [Pelagimonas sp. KU-00592-HH]
MSYQEKMKGQCSKCGWVTRRTFKNMGRKPCPKCGGQVLFHEDDKEAAQTIAILSIVGTIVIGFLFVALGIAEW